MSKDLNKLTKAKLIQVVLGSINDCNLVRERLFNARLTIEDLRVELNRLKGLNTLSAYNNPDRIIKLQRKFIKTHVNNLPKPSKPITNKEEFFKAVLDTVDSSRHKDYGSAEESFAIIAGFWSVYITSKYGKGEAIRITEVDVSLMMDLLKTSRLVSNPKHMDSWLDKAGYTACGVSLKGK